MRGKEAISLTGDKRLQKQLDRLSDKAAKRALRKATRAATTVLGKAVRRETPKDEGVLKKAQTTQVTSKGFNARGKAGADYSKFKGQRPSNIDWLIEFGHVSRDGTFVPPHGGMRRAEASAMPQALATYAAKLEAEIMAEASK